MGKITADEVEIGRRWSCEAIKIHDSSPFYNNYNDDITNVGITYKLSPTRRRVGLPFLYPICHPSN